MRQTLRDMLAPLTLCLLTALSAAAPAAAQAASAARNSMLVFNVENNLVVQ